MLNNMLARTGWVLSMQMVMRSMLLLVLLTSSGVLSFDFLSWERESGVRETSYRDLQDLPQFLGNQTHRDYFKNLCLVSINYKNPHCTYCT